MPKVFLPGGGCAVHPGHPRAPVTPALWACEDVYPWQVTSVCIFVPYPVPIPTADPVIHTHGLSITHPCSHPSSYPCIHLPFPVLFPVPIPILNPAPIPIPIPIPYRVRAEVLRVEHDSLRVAVPVPGRR